MAEEVLIRVADVVFRGDLYPRLETSMATVQKYAEDLGVLPAIEVNQKNELIDGWHRWTAHKKAEAAEIRAVVTETRSDAHLLELAIRRNATHGLQLSQEDKRDMARRIYESTPEKDRSAKKEELREILSVDKRTVYNWLSRIDKDARTRQRQQVCTFRFAGCFAMVFDAGGPERGRPLSWWRFGDKEPRRITTDQLDRILRFELHPETLRPVDYRSHHDTGITLPFPEREVRYRHER